MSQTTLIYSATASLLAGLLYLYVGKILRTRKLSPEAQLAGNMFVLWWEALGALSILGSAILIIYVFEGLATWIYETYLVLVLLVLFVALWGLQFYLVYLYTGSRKWFVPLGIFYTAFFVFTLGLIQSSGAVQSVTDDGWALSAEPALNLSTPLSLAFSTLLIGPQIVAAVAYGLLYTKTQERSQRYRIALVTGAIVFWFGSSLVATAIQINTSPAWQVASRLISVLAALTILMAYRPPAWIRNRFHIESATHSPTMPEATHH